MEKWLFLRPGQEIYKMNLKHLMVLQYKGSEIHNDGYVKEAQERAGFDEMIERALSNLKITNITP